ncbi:MAG: sensor histidine kinase [Actinobacteria bacterium]|nr:sensor histidine kinase [Actinomycetota bacterium]
MLERAWRRLGAYVGNARSSLWTKLLVGFVVAVTVVIAATILLDTRLTRGTLQQQARDTLQGELEVLRASFTDRQSTLIAGLRNTSQTLAYRELIGTENRAVLINELGSTQRDLRMDTIGVVLPDGRVHVTIGVGLPDLPPEALDDLIEGPGHHLIPTTDGRYVQLAAVPVGGPEPSGVLVGGYLFDDSSAFQLRLLGGNDVLLVADGRLVGSTLGDSPASPPGFTRDYAEREPTVIPVDGAETFVDYVPMFASAGPWEAEGAVGIAIPEPLARLDRQLLRNRVVGAAVIAVVVGFLALYVERIFARPLLGLARTAKRIASGDPDARFEASTSDEIGLLAQTLEQMRRATQHQLMVIRDQAQELRTASERIVTAQDEERRRLANDLHDGLQRQLVLVSARLGLFRQLRSDDPETAEAILEELERDAQAAIKGLRETSQRIFPTILQDRGLEGGLNSLVGRAPVNVQLETDPDPLPRIDGRVEINAYQLVSEALTNVVKHADATSATIVAKVRDGALIVEVNDDGCGFDPRSVGDEGGLRHLRDRVAAVGGSLDVRSVAGEGTSVQALLPLSEVTSADGELSPRSVEGSTAPPPRVGSDRGSR